MTPTDDKLAHIDQHKLQAIWHVNRQGAGLGDDGYDPDLVETVLGERIETRPQAQDLLQRRPDLLAEEWGVDIHGPKPTSQEAVALLDVPSLPDRAKLNPSIGTSIGEWLDAYTNHAEAVSPMTPRTFHVSAGLWLGAVAIARRLVLPMSFGDVFPNIFVAWIAPTTLFRKTTGLNVANDLAYKVFPHLLAAQDTTPEAFLSDLAGREPPNLDSLPEQDREDWKRGRNFAGQRGWILDEMSGLLAQAGRDYNAGLLEALLRFYDCAKRYRRSTRGQGLVIVRHTYLSLLGASTPTAMREHLLSEQLWGSGWWPRFAVLTPKGNRPSWKLPKEPGSTGNLEAGLRRVYEGLPEATWPDPPEPQAMMLGTGVFDAWKPYRKAVSYDLLTDDLDHRLWGSYGRLPMQALKVAMILAAFDWKPGTTPVIELPHLARAMEITESWRESAHRTLAQMAASRFDRLQERVIRQVGRQEPKGASLRDVYRGMRDQEPNEIESCIEQLVKVGMLEVERDATGPKGGRPTDRYHLV